MLKLFEILKKGRKNKPRNNTFTLIQTKVTKAAITVRTPTFYIFNYPIEPKTYLIVVAALQGQF